jgi:hypothetical protein
MWSSASRVEASICSAAAAASEGGVVRVTKTKRVTWQKRRKRSADWVSGNFAMRCSRTAYFSVTSSWQKLSQKAAEPTGAPDACLHDKKKVNYSS